MASVAVPMVPDEVSAPASLRHHPGEAETGRTQERAQHHLGQRAAPQAAEELRADAIADRKQEHQEEHGAHGSGHRYADLADQEPGDERPQHGADLEAADADLAEDVADREREKQRELHMFAQRTNEPLHEPSSRRANGWPAAIMWHIED